MKHFFPFFRGPGAIIYNPGEPKCQLLQTSSQSGHIQEGKTFNNQFLLYGSECEKYIFLAIWCVCVGGGGGGGALQ